MHRDFGIKPKCCSQDMYLDEDDDTQWFECENCGNVSVVPEGYYDNTPTEVYSPITK